jgi:excisionase family DNA binding protein
MKYLTVEEAAAYLRVSRSTIYGLCHQKRITYRKHGSRSVFTKEDLDTFSQINFYILPVALSIGHRHDGKVLRPKKRTSSLKIAQKERGPSQQWEKRDG